MKKAMTTKELIEQVLKNVNFNTKQVILINDRESYEGYDELEKKLQEAMEIVKKYNLI